MQILGVSCHYHDAAAALLRDGQLLAAVEEERFTRIKHDFGFPHHAIRYCLEQGGVRGPKLDYVVFFEKPFRKFERVLSTLVGACPRSRRAFVQAMSNWLFDKLWVKEQLVKELGIAPERILFCEHHLSHAASCFYLSPFRQAAILTVDGVGEWTTAMLARGRELDITPLAEIRFPHSVGLLYSVFTAFLGFEVNEGEYKVMGMAPYGQPRFLDKIRRIVEVAEDGSIWLDLDYFSFQHEIEIPFNARFLELFGEPRAREAPFFTADHYPSYFGPRSANFAELAARNQFYADIAASIQAFTEDVLLRMARYLRQQTGEKMLCMAGGVALNSVANGRLLREAGFERMFIQPSAGDGGGAVGAAFYAYHGLLRQSRQFVLEHAYWGPEFDATAIQSFLESNNIEAERCDTAEKLVERVTAELLAGRVVGWFQGRAEFGPRALGNRSILADPRRAEMRDIVNTKIKFREPYRPFAPSVLAECAAEYFELPCVQEHYPARFMLLVVPVRSDRIPATTHVDGTGRLHTVRRAENPLYYDLIHSFAQAAGVPAVLNTSFNLKGEPIVNTPAEAYRTFCASDMDVLVLGPYLMRK